MDRFAISPVHRALVFGALAANALVTLALLAETSALLVYVAAFGAMPVALLKLEPAPGAFRFTAAALALAYGTVAYVTAPVLAPAAVLLGAAALVPGNTRFRGAVWGAEAAMLVATTLLIIARL